MAILRTLTRRQMELIGADMAKAVERRMVMRKPVITQEDLALVAAYTGKIEVCPVGKPLRATHHWQSDYRSFTPKGARIKRDVLRENGTTASWSFK